MTAEIVVDIHGYSGLGAEFVKAEVTSTGMRVTICGALADALSARTAELEAEVRRLTLALDDVVAHDAIEDDFGNVRVAEYKAAVADLLSLFDPKFDLHTAFAYEAYHKAKALLDSNKPGRPADPVNDSAT